MEAARPKPLAGSVRDSPTALSAGTPRQRVSGNIERYGPPKEAARMRAVSGVKGGVSQHESTAKVRRSQLILEAHRFGQKRKPWDAPLASVQDPAITPAGLMPPMPVAAEPGGSTVVKVPSGARRKP